MTLFLLLACCFSLSIFFSASEMAFVSCNKLKLKRFVGEGRKGAIAVQEFQRQPRTLLAALLFGNNLVNVSVTALTAYILKGKLGIENEFVTTLVVAPFLIIFAETVPKDYGRQKADDIIYQWAPLMRFFYILFRPVARWILALPEALLRVLGGDQKKSPFVTKEEFHRVIEESARQGVINEPEKRLIDTILNFERIRVEEVMTPLASVSKIEITGKVGDLKKLARETGDSFILVYEEIPSLVVGAVYVFDTLFISDENQPLSPFLRPPLFVFREESAEKAFLKLQQSHQSFAVVLDADRDPMGVVAIDNLLAV